MPQLRPTLVMASAITACCALFACGGHAGAPPIPTFRRGFASTTQSSAYANAVLADRPVRYYRLNETNGPSAFESAGTGSYGTYDGPVLFGAGGPLLDESSTAIAANGGAYDVGVAIPAALSGTGSYSIETWVRPELSKTYMTVWGFSTSHRLLVNSSGYLLSQFDGNFFSKRALSNGAWHDVVFVYDATAGTQAYYIDGALDSSASIPPAAAAFASPYYLGEYDTSGNYKWHGAIAEHAVYAYALSASQIRAHYDAAGYPPASPAPQPTAAPTPPGDAACGGYRWSVKVATDADASAIALTPVRQTTLAWLTGIPKPNTDDSLPRLAPTETAAYELTNVTVTQVFHAVDGDYHLVLQDAQGRTMIAESPDPACAPDSALYSEIAAVHQQIAQHYPGLSPSPASVDDTISLEGIPFFDYAPNYATGQAPNGVEIHPILGICFGANCTPAAPAPAAPSSPSPSPQASPAPGDTSAYANAVLADGPREYYTFDESGGTTLYDSSGNGENGSYTGAVTFGVPGPLQDERSGAIALAGGTAGAGALAPDPNAGAGSSYTIVLWVDPGPSSDYMTLWGYSSTHRLLLSGGGRLLSQLDGNFFSKGTLARSVWHQVAFVYDASTQTASYYIDGRFDSSAAVSPSAAAFTSPYYFGQYDTSSNYKWYGRLAQGAFYSSALSASQIASDYEAAGYAAASPTPAPATYQSAVLSASPLEYLQLEDASGPAAVDSSGNADNGAYVGSVRYGAAGPLKNQSSSAISLQGGPASEGVALPNPDAAAGTSYSIELWVDAAPANGYMSLWGYDSTHRLLLSSTGALLSQLSGNFFSKTTLTRGAWHQVVFVYDASAQTASYYIDGKFDSSASVPPSAAAFTSAYYLGQYDSSSNYKWAGRLGQEAFYSSALSASAIAEQYSAAGY